MKKKVLIFGGSGFVGHYVLSKKAIFYYKQNTLYDRTSQFTINWKDPEFKIKWPCKKPLLSTRDR